MTLTRLKLALLFSALIITALADIQIGTPLTLLQQWSLVYAIEPQAFVEFNFVYAQLPRLIMAVIIGAMLGLVGSLMQQLTQNPLTSPLTLGTSSGAWLALIIANVWFPSIAADHMALAAMT
ncbi:MAG: ABC-type Fe3+-siderophore transport system permease subunit, partial [Psychromonas sp.]|uniref:iron chelate uptake ABC transporter family permease subunit n=1 Tax=Psychromonas sp. TaxID=1884585 RepID=UPI0039E34ABD